MTRQHNTPSQLPQAHESSFKLNISKEPHFVLLPPPVATPTKDRGKSKHPHHDGLLTRSETADYLNVSRRWLEADTTVPKINIAGPHRRRMWRYKRSDLDAWLTAKANPKAPSRGGV